MKVLAILYNGFKAAQQEPRLLGTVENKVCRSVSAPRNLTHSQRSQLGLSEWLKARGHEFIGTRLDLCLLVHIANASLA